MDLFELLLIELGAYIWGFYSERREKVRLKVCEGKTALQIVTPSFPRVVTLPSLYLLTTLGVNLDSGISFYLHLL